jgi:uncharacterized protein DUF5677
MAKTMLPTTPEIQRATLLLDEVIQRLGESLSKLPQLGKYESDYECRIQLALTVRHIESVIELARRDLVLYPSAMVLARAAFETAANIMWVMSPTNPFDREARWLAMLGEYAKLHKRLADRIKNPAHRSSLMKEYIRLEDLRAGITRKLPRGSQSINHLPNFDARLKTLGVDDNYVAYIITSQFTHGTLAASYLYKTVRSGREVSGEFVTPEHWVTPLRICWWSIRDSAKLFLSRVGGKPQRFLPSGLEAKAEAAIDAVRGAQQTSGEPTR